jgi:hypothetical protein
MTRRARLYDLAARADAQQVAGLARALGAARTEAVTATALDHKLRDLIGHLAPTSGPQPAATLRNTSALISQIAQEADHHRDRAQAAATQMHALQALIVTHSQRQRTHQDAASAARQAAAQAAQDRAEAAQPPSQTNSAAISR